MNNSPFEPWDSFPQNRTVPFEIEPYDVSFAWMHRTEEIRDEECSYVNAATCPDCGAGMVRQCGCTSCSACGWGSCG